MGVGGVGVGMELWRGVMGWGGDGGGGCEDEYIFRFIYLFIYFISFYKSYIDLFQKCLL